MKKLIIGQIPDNFDPDIHIPVSPSCFIGKEEVYPEFENLQYLNIDNSRGDLKKYDQICTKEALYWVSIIAKKYNSDEFDKHSFRFWKTLYFPWLGDVIPWFYRKQLLIMKIIEKYRNEEITIELIEDNLVFEFKNEIDFIIDGIWNQTINEWIYSRIIESNLPDKWNINYKEGCCKSDKETTYRFNKSKSLKRKIADSIYKACFRSRGVYGFNIIDEIFFHFLLSFKPPIKVNRGKAINHKISQINWSFNVIQIIEFLIPQCLSKINFDENKRKFKKGKLINCSNRLYYNFNTKIDAAYAIENKEIIVATQHGGHNYGSAFTFEYGINIEFHSEYFISWGNYMFPNCNLDIIKPLPSPFLSNYLNTHITKNNKIILVGTYMNLFLSYFDSAPIEVERLIYRKNKLEFLNNLMIANVWYRPYNEKYTCLLDWDYISKNSTNVNNLEGNLHVELQQCKLLILDHPGTTLNIAMAMNTPTICFWERNHFPFNKEAELFLDRFKDLGLYFEDPKKAAEKVNDIISKYNDLSRWWNCKEVQDLRKEWMSVYARADKNWFWIWSKTLWSLGK